MTVTFDLPESLARQLLALPEPERNRFALERLRDEDAELPTPPRDFHPVNLDDLPPGDKEFILRGLADSDAGRVVPATVVFAELRAVCGRGAK